MAKPDLVKEMNAYYARHAPYHDGCMGYTDNTSMEKLLAPIIKHIEPFIDGRDVLEIACGTGNWTQVLAERAGSVLATDINAPVIEIAQLKSYMNMRVRFEIADAYALGEVDGTFNAAFAADWWSHIPRSMITAFVEGLHNRLRPGANVVFIDMLPRPELELELYHRDDEGNLVRQRRLPDGSEFHVVKNFPTEKELKDIFNGIANNIEYYEDLPLKRWVLTYTLK